MQLARPLQEAVLLVNGRSAVRIRSPGSQRFSRLTCTYVHVGLTFWCALAAAVSCAVRVRLSGSLGWRLQRYRQPDVVSLVELLLRQDSSALAAIWPALVRRPLEIVVDAMKFYARNLGVDLRSVINHFCERSNEDLVAFLVAVHGRIQGTDVGRMLRIAAKRHPLVEAYPVASSLKASGIVDAGNRFLEVSVAESPMPEVVSTMRGLRSHRKAR
jgi:hypothetical protein